MLVRFSSILMPVKSSSILLLLLGLVLFNASIGVQKSEVVMASFLQCGLYHR